MASRTRPPETLPPFGGFGRDVVAFFADLDTHQTRAWFEANRATYDAQARGPMASLVVSLSLALAARDIPLEGDPKRALFRIHRDIRFSPDKRPYRTNVAAVLTRDGDKRSQGLLYVDIGLQGCFAALGFYRPDPGQLGAIREHMRDAPERWRSVERSLDEAGLTLSREHLASRLPRDIDPVQASGLEEVLRLRSFTVSRPLMPDEIAKPGLIDLLADFAAAGLPLLRFGWSALARRPVAERVSSGGPGSPPQVT